MAKETMKYSADPYESRGMRSDREDDRIVTPQSTYFQHERNGFSNRQSEAAPFGYERSQEMPPQQSRYDYHNQISAYYSHVDRPFPRSHEESQYEIHRHHAALGFPPPRLNYHHERVPRHVHHLPRPRPITYNQDHNEAHTYPFEGEAAPKLITRRKIQTVVRSVARGDHYVDANTEPAIKQSQSTDSGAAALVGEGKNRKRGEKGTHTKTSPPESKEDMLNDALLLASIAKMAESKTDIVPKTNSHFLIERTVSIDAKDSSQMQRASTPSPRYGDDCKAVTPSLSSRLVVLHEEAPQEIESQSIIKNKLSQVSVESSESLERSKVVVKTCASREQLDGALPRHPLSFSREEHNLNHRPRSPSLTGRDSAMPRKLLENEGGPSSHDSDHHRGFQSCHEDNHHRSYLHQTPISHDRRQERFPVYRPPPRYEEASQYDEEGRFHRYPLQPMYPHRSTYLREERSHFYPPAQFHRPPIYRGVETHYVDRRSFDGPLQGPVENHPIRQTDFRLSSHRRLDKSLNQGQSLRSGKIVLRRKCAWKNYPELEQFLIENREDYLRHSAMNYTQEQKQFNNELTERLLEVASKHNYEFDRNDFNFVAIRDRIRCYYKSYVQNCKKRGLLATTKISNNKKLKIEETKDTNLDDVNDATRNENNSVRGDDEECSHDL